MIAGILSIRALTMPEIMSGIAFTIVTIMVGRALTSEMSKSMPA